MNPLKLDPGQLNKRVNIMQKSEVPDGAGGLTINWVLADSVWAKIHSVGAAVTIEGQQEQETVSHKFLIRNPVQISSGWRLVMGSRTFEVKSIIDPDELGGFQELSTEEVGK